MKDRLTQAELTELWQQGAVKTGRHARAGTQPAAPAAANAPPPATDYKALFLQQVALAGLPPPSAEHVFHPVRQWRLDFVWEAERVAVEYQGILGAAKASHASVKNLLRDYRKFSEAALAGWLLLLIDAQSVASGEALGWVEKALDLRGKTENKRAEARQIERK